MKISHMEGGFLLCSRFSHRLDTVLQKGVSLEDNPQELWHLAEVYATPLCKQLY